jgi:hypothetical protein
VRSPINPKGSRRSFFATDRPARADLYRAVPPAPRARGQRVRSITPRCRRVATGIELAQVTEVSADHASRSQTS